MKKHHFLRGLFSLTLFLIVGAAFWNYLDLPSEKELLTQGISRAKSNPVDSLRELFGGEPQEVVDLRAAEVAETDEGHQEYYFKQLSSDEKRVYREMLTGIRGLEEEFYLSQSDETLVNRIYSAVLKDHPEIYWVHNREHVYRTTYGDSKYCMFSPGYSYTMEEMQQINAGIDSLTQQVLSSIPEGASDYEKVQIVYTWVIDHADYVSSEHDQNIAGIFWKQAAVCAGYAGAVQYLLEKVGVPVIYVEGDAEDSDEGHAWNIVTIEGQYYIVDATNGDQPQFLEGDAVQLAEHKTTIYDYLCPFPEEYATSYTPSDDFSVPECTSHAKNFYVMNQACFDTYDWQNVYDLCVLRIQNNAAVLRFKFATQEAFDAACADWKDGDSAQQVAQYYLSYNGLSQVEYHCGVLSNLKTIYYIF